MDKQNIAIDKLKTMVIKPKTIGIDLGTTNSCVAAWRNGKVEIIPNEHGTTLTPSVVAFTDKQRLFGEDAENQAAMNPANTVYNVKRLVGRKYDDPRILYDLQHLSYQVLNEYGKPTIQLQYKNEPRRFTPEEISSMILTKLKEAAEEYLGAPVHDAVITVPAYFNDAQRQATIDAGTIAGLNIIRIINEPTAAALAYGMDKNWKDEKNVLVFDIGGGTFDVSVLNVDEGCLFEVLATSGNTHLGGTDFDDRLVSYMVEEFTRRYGRDVTNNARAMKRLRSAAEYAKCELSLVTETTVEIEALCDGIDFFIKLSRNRFEDLCQDLFDETMQTVTITLHDAKLTKQDVHEVILVGGSTRIPKIQEMLKEFFANVPINFSINPEETVAYGAAIQAAIMCGEENEKIQDLLLLDVNPISLGIETAGSVMTKVVEHNTRIPSIHTKTFSTFEDNQPGMTIDVFEGERALTRDNDLLGTFDIVNIPEAPRGTNKVEVSFDVDANSILTVSAKEQNSGLLNNVIMRHNAARLSQVDIERMISDAEKFKAEDDQYRNEIAARNQLESYIFAAKQAIRNCGEDLTMDERFKVENECEECLRWMEDNAYANKMDYDDALNEMIFNCSPILKKIKNILNEMQQLKKGPASCGQQAYYNFKNKLRDHNRFNEINK